MMKIDGIKLNKIFIKIKHSLKIVFCSLYLMLMINCKAGNTNLSSTSNNPLNNNPNINRNASGIPNIQDQKNGSGVPNGQDGQSQGQLSNSQDGTNTHQMSFTQPAKQQVDFLIVVDKSLSMQENHKTFLESSHFQNLFSGSLEYIDWQMLFTDTFVDSIYSSFDDLEDSNGKFTTSTGDHTQILSPKLGTNDYLEEIFTNTLYQGSQTSNKSYDTEEPLANIINKLLLPENSNLFRSDAALAIIIISDEDELSTGGSDATNPSKVIQAISNNLDQSKQFSTYGIIIQPGDQQCLSAEQAKDEEIVTSSTYQTRTYEENENPNCPGHYTYTTHTRTDTYTDNGGGSYGYFINELANLTNGITTSICNDNYNSITSDIEKKFTANRISNKIELEHTDIIENTISVTFTPSANAPTWQFNSQENTITLNTPLAEGAQIQISYSYE